MSKKNVFPSRNRRKSDQAYEMAGLARQDGDQKDAERWMAEAKKYEQLANEEGE